VKFARSDGSLFIHRELAAALQVLRNQQEASLTIEGFDPPQGVGADARSTGSRKTGLAAPWEGYLQAVGKESKFRDIERGL
jgi:hypothetical protein